LQVGIKAFRLVGESMEKYKKIIEKRLSKKRYEHSLGVAETAKKLAVFNNVNSDDAYIAGLLHDYAKELSSQELLQIAKNNQLIVDEVEIIVPQLLHGPVGAYLLEQEMGVKNKDILQAVRFHTTGCYDMGTLSQILYIADIIEPNRKFPEVDYLRQITYEDLSLGVLEGLNFSLKYVLEKNKLIHCLSVQARNWLLITIKTMNYIIMI